MASVRVSPGPINRESLQVDEIVVDLYDRVARLPPDHGRLRAHNGDGCIELAVAFGLQVFVVLFVEMKRQGSKYVSV